MDIYSILASKPHNPHYLNRYWKFIQSCQVANQNLPKETYTERHHICPKAKDLFPEYTDFRKNEWNKIVLTARQHIIAHILLWKVYKGSQATSLMYFLGVQNNDHNPKNMRFVTTAQKTRYLAKIREEVRENRIGFAVYKTKNDEETFFLHRNDPLIKELDLVGLMYGRKLNLSDEALKHIAYNAYLKRKVKMYFLNIKRVVQLLSEEYCLLLENGWTTTLSEEDRNYINNKRAKLAGKKRVGKYMYALPNGSFYGILYTNSSLIKELGLIKYETDKQKSQRSGSFQEGAVKALIGSTVYTNGIDEIKLQPEDIIPDGYYPGRRPRTDTHSKNQKAASSAMCKGATTYNDGIKNYFVKPGDEIPSHWVKGMKPQKERTEFLISNGTQYRKLRKNEKIPEGYFRAKASELHKKELEKIPFFHEVYTPKPGVK